MNRNTIEKVDLNNKEHSDALIMLLNEYMKDEMGNGKLMAAGLAPKIINGLKLHPAYLGFLVKQNDEFVGLANCNLNYSTWQARFIINIHDFIIHPKSRNQGIGAYLLKEIEDYATANNYCKLNLEVRTDNIKAKTLYKKAGFKTGNPEMLFWEKQLLV